MAVVVDFVEDIFESVGDAVGDVVEFAGDAIGEVANAVGNVVEGAVDVVKEAGSALDDAVRDIVPGGWATVAAIGATVATMGMTGPALATTELGAEAAATMGAEASAWSTGSIVDSLGTIAEKAGTAAIKGAGMGAGSSLITGGDPLQGALKGAIGGGLGGGFTSGFGELGLDPTLSKAASSVATSTVLGGDPTKALENAAFGYGVGELANETGIDRSILQPAANVAKATLEGKDFKTAATNALVNSAVKSGVNTANTSFSEIYKDALDHGFTPEESYTIASSPIETSQENEFGYTNATTDEYGNTIYTYDDGSQLYVDPEGNPWDATEATSEYADTYEDVYNDPFETAQADTYVDNYQDQYVDPQAEPVSISPVTEPSLETAPVEGGLPSDITETPTVEPGGLPTEPTPSETTTAAAPKVETIAPPSVEAALTKKLTSIINPPPARPARPVSRARQVQTQFKPTNTLSQTQAQANALLNTPGYTAPTSMAGMTPAERMAAIAAYNKSTQPFAEGGAVDPTEGFIDPQANKYLRALIMHGNRGNYNLPGYPFGQQFRLGMAEGGLTSQHDPKFFSEGGLNSLQNKFVQGAGDGTSDSIPAMLANGEFVIPADVVASLGNGSNDSGAKVLDEFLKTIRKHKRNADHRKLPPDSKGPLGYLLEAKRKVKK